MKLATVTFEAGSQLATIGDYAFSSCPALETITIPASVTTIGSDAFYNYTKLATVTLLPATPPSMGQDAFKIIGSTTSGDKKFYFHGTAYGTNEYSAWNDMYSNTNGGSGKDFSSWTTTVIGTLTLSDGATTSTAAFVSDGTDDYYKQGTSITLGHDNPPAGYTFDGYTAKDADDNDITATVISGSTLTMPAGDVTAKA